MSNVLCELLRKAAIHPVLIDIGASGGTFEIWDAIAPESVYVGFDPDQREIREIRDGKFHRAVMVNKAVVDKPEMDHVNFYLTKSPYCSSALEPDKESLRHYLFWDLFTVRGEVKVDAATLDSVAGQLALPRIDWFKTDSQGTDLRLFKSIRDEVRRHILAVDIEPGLIDAYRGEDLFVDAHRDLVASGFWLSRLNVPGVVRMQESSIRSILGECSDLDRRAVEKTVRPSPGWCEARYLRTLEWLAEHRMEMGEYVRLWVFAMMDNQPGFALDTVLDMEKIFGPGEMSGVMRRESIARIRCIMKEMDEERGMKRLKDVVFPLQLRRWIRSVLVSFRRKTKC